MAPGPSSAAREPGPGERLTLPDGRGLGWTEYGDPAGRPVLYFHGWPGSRLEPRTAVPFLRNASVRLIAADRPGMGLSDFQPDRTFLDWPPDVAALADHLGLERFAVLGVSGGGPYASACALALPDRITAAGILAGMGPLDAPGAMRKMYWPNRLMISLARIHPRLVWWPLKWFDRQLRKSPDRAFWRMVSTLPERDREALGDGAMRDAIVASFRESFRQGPEGPARDGLLYLRPWTMPLDRIPVPVFLWHGEADAHVPVGQGRWVAEAIPGCRARFVPEEGHFSLMVHYVEEILGVLSGSD